MANISSVYCLGKNDLIHFFSHLEILVDAQGWLVEVYLDVGDPITQQIP